MGKKVKAHVLISGRVQGVFFRMETKRVAENYGVFGWVRNLSDGKVEAVFEGNKESVDAMLKWCDKGPAHAKVDRVDVRWQDCSGEFEGFDITY